MSYTKRITLHARTWVALPDTRYEVYLKGKSGALIITRGRRAGRLAGWRLPQGRCYLRHALDGANGEGRYHPGTGSRRAVQSAA